MHTHTRQHLQWLVLKRSNVFYFLCGKFTHCGSNPSRSPPDPSPWLGVQGAFLWYLQGIKIHGKYNQAGRISGIGNDWVGIFFLVQILNAILGTFVEQVHSCVGTESAIEINYLFFTILSFTSYNVWFSKSGQFQCWAVQFGKLLSIIVWEWHLSKMEVIWQA